MALVNITPVMTSNTTPSPYTISQSSYYSTGNLGWRAFDGTFSGNADAWVGASGTTTGWVQIDFSVQTKIDAISLMTRNYTNAPIEMLKDAILLGSNDGTTFQSILYINSQTNWKSSESRLFELSIPVSFRYYRLQINTNNGGGILSLGELYFWQDDGESYLITNKKASLNYCLPKNSTLAMELRQNDSREGLLGFADDGANYGTLWIINANGKAQIPFAKMPNVDTLFDGVANTIKTPYQLSANVTNYRCLLVTASISNSQVVSNYIMTKDITYGIDYGYFIGGYNDASYNYNLDFGFLTNNTFQIEYRGISSAWSGGGAINKIYGIK